MLKWTPTAGILYSGPFTIRKSEAPGSIFTGKWEVKCLGKHICFEDKLPEAKAAAETYLRKCIEKVQSEDSATTLRGKCN